MTEEEIKAMQEENKKLSEIVSDVRKENADWRTKERENSKALADMQAKLSDIESAREKDKMMSEKDFESIIEKTKQEFTEKLTASETANAKLAQNLRNTVVDKELVSYASKAVSPKQVLLLAKDEYQFDMDENSHPVVMKDGKPALDASGAALSLSGVVESILAANPNLVPAGAAGSGSLGGKGAPSALTANEKIAQGLSAGIR